MHVTKIKLFSLFFFPESICPKERCLVSSERPSEKNIFVTGLRRLIKLYFEKN